MQEICTYKNGEEHPAVGGPREFHPAQISFLYYYTQPKQFEINIAEFLCWSSEKCA